MGGTQRKNLTRLPVKSDTIDVISRTRSDYIVIATENAMTLEMISRIQVVGTAPEILNLSLLHSQNTLRFI